MAGRSGWQRPTPTIHEAVQFPGRQSKTVPAYIFTANRSGKRGIRLALEQWPVARTLPRRQSDLPQSWHKRTNAGYLCGSLTRARDGARDQDWRLGPTGVALRQGPRPGASDRTGGGQRTLHADELFG